eukprot:365864-Chlamydomonas_euryale.AAC.3
MTATVDPGVIPRQQPDQEYVMGMKPRCGRATRSSLERVWSGAEWPLRGETLCGEYAMRMKARCGRGTEQTSRPCYCNWRAQLSARMGTGLARAAVSAHGRMVGGRSGQRTWVHSWRA